MRVASMQIRYFIVLGIYKAHPMIMMYGNTNFMVAYLMDVVRDR